MHYKKHQYKGWKKHKTQQIGNLMVTYITVQQRHSFTVLYAATKSTVLEMNELPSSWISSSIRNYFWTQQTRSNPFLSRTWFLGLDGFQCRDKRQIWDTKDVMCLRMINIQMDKQDAKIITLCHTLHPQLHVLFSFNNGVTSQMQICH